MTERGPKPKEAFEIEDFLGKLMRQEFRTPFKASEVYINGRSSVGANMQEMHDEIEAWNMSFAEMNEPEMNDGQKRYWVAFVKGFEAILEKNPHFELPQEGSRISDFPIFSSE